MILVQTTEHWSPYDTPNYYFMLLDFDEVNYYRKEVITRIMVTDE